MPQQVDLTMIILNLLSGAVLLALLGVLTRVGWAVVRTRATTRQHLLRTARQRLVPALWVVLVAFAATAAYGEIRGTSMGLPNVWEVAAAKGYRAYALLGLGAYLSVAQVFVGLGLLTKAAQMASGRHGGGSDLAAALASTLIMTAALFAVLAMAAVGYVQLLAHSAM